MELNPRLVFERMFGGGLGSPEQRAARLRNRRSVLDMVAGEARQLQGRLTPADRGRMDDYLQNIREIELRLERTEQQNAASVGTPGSPVGVPDDYGEHVGLMFDLMAVAFQADITRVFTFMMGRELSSRTYPHLGITEPHHAVSHHQNKPERIEKYATTNAYHAQLVGKYLGQAEGDSRRATARCSINSLLLWGSGMSNPNIHSFDPLPVVLLGGDSGHLKGGRHVVTPRARRWRISCCRWRTAAAWSARRFGDSTGTVRSVAPEAEHVTHSRQSCAPSRCCCGLRRRRPGAQRGPGARRSATAADGTRPASRRCTARSRPTTWRRWSG